ncbi:MAG TPA: enoyl-CoA hydratase-related protein [Planctomycetota bacterium]|nr:enoyl-CoA hydratase-related protein [Planctomycetota bacterium]
MAQGGFRVEPGRVTRIVLTAPPLNVLTTALARELAAAVSRLAENPAHRVLAIAAEGKAFSAGASIEEHVEASDAEAMLAAMDALIRALDAHPRPVVALVRGACLGGGLELALACDMIWASERAALGCPEIKLGVLAPFATALLPRKVGTGRALELLLTGEALPAEVAQNFGLVERVYKDESFEPETVAALEKLAERSGPALGVARLAVREALAAKDLGAALDRMRLVYRNQTLGLADAREGLTAFLEKRAAVWQDR